jgi:pimeloyl-ACP methyl ester carboxylesterase
MAATRVNDRSVSYEVIGNAGARPWVITPGGRFSKDSPGVRELADVLAGLLRQLDMTPAVIAGGSGGARVSLLTASRHRDVASGLATWWISGGVFGLTVLGVHYCGESLKAAWNGTMADVAALPEWGEVIERNPANRELFLREDRAEFVATTTRSTTRS